MRAKQSTPELRSAAVFSRKCILLIQPQDQADSGVYVGARPVESLPSDADPEVLGATLREALNRGRAGIPHPTDWASIERPLLEAAGVKSSSTLMKGTVYCSCTDDGETIRVIPSRNRGSRSGFEHLESMALTLPSEAPASRVGTALLEALSKSR